jgi:hypothetical protein
MATVTDSRCEESGNTFLSQSPPSSLSFLSKRRVSKAEVKNVARSKDVEFCLRLIHRSSNLGRAGSALLIHCSSNSSGGGEGRKEGRKENSLSELQSGGLSKENSSSR